MVAISDAVPAGAVARVLGIKTGFVDLREGNILFLPQRIAVIAQGNSAAVYTTDKQQVLSRKQAGDLYGYGSPIERIVNQLLPANGDGVGTIPVTIYPLEDSLTGVPAAGSIDAAGVQAGTESYVVKVNEIPTASFSIPDLSTADVALGIIKTAIDAVVEMPILTGVVAAGSLPVTAKWDGETGNGIVIEIEGEASGIVYTITQPAGGANNPDVQDALDLIGDVWETMVVSGLNYDDSDTLDKYDTFNEGRWLPLGRQPLVVFTGFLGDEATGVAVTDARKNDRTNVFASAPGSNNLPFVVAARNVARAAVIANQNPPHDYAGRRLTGIVPGPDSDQWDYLTRNDAVSKGLSTVKLVDGVLEMDDTVSMYHPTGEEIPGYRYVADIVKLQNIIFNLALIFESDDWKGKPLVDDGTPTTNPDARKPKDAKAAVATMIDSLAAEAIISEPETAKASIQAEIDGANPKRINVAFTAKISGNTNIVSIDFKFGFDFG